VTVRTSLVLVRVEEVARDRAGVLARDFVDDERASLAGRPDRSVAGRLAVKRALCELWTSLAPGTAVAGRDFVLSCEASEAPRLLDAPGPVPTPSIRISIAHSPRLAAGMAAAPRPGDRA
jgi:hypothetical protein